MRKNIVFKIAMCLPLYLLALWICSKFLDRKTEEESSGTKGEKENGAKRGKDSGRSGKKGKSE